MPSQSWNQALVAAQVDGTALVSSTTPTSLLPGQGKFTLPANFFETIGKSMRVLARGRISTVVTTPGTLTLDFRLGTIASPIVVFNGGAMNLNTTAQVNATWMLEAILTARSVGSGTAATLMGIGSFTSRAIIGSAVVAAGGVTSTPLPDTAPAVGTGFDSTITNVMDFFAAWSISNAANSIQLHQFLVESMN